MTGEPLLDNNSFVGFIKETVKGTRQSLATGARWLDLISEDFMYEPILLELESAIGDRQSRAEHNIISHFDCRGSVTFRPRANDINQLIDLLFKDVDTTYFAPVSDGTDLESATIEVQKFGNTEYALTGAVLNTLNLKSEENGPLIATAEFIAMSGEEDPGDLTTATFADWIDSTPFMHSALVIDATGAAFLGGTDGPICKSIEIELSNNLSEEGYGNSTDRQIIPVGMFTMTGNFVIPYNSTTDGYLAAWSGGAIVGPVSLKWFNGNGDDVEFIINFEVIGDKPVVAGDGSHKWQQISFKGVYDASHLYIAKAKYSAAI